VLVFDDCCAVAFLEHQDQLGGGEADDVARFQEFPDLAEGLVGAVVGSSGYLAGPMMATVPRSPGVRPSV